MDTSLTLLKRTWQELVELKKERDELKTEVAHWKERAETYLFDQDLYREQCTELINENRLLRAIVNNDGNKYESGVTVLVMGKPVKYWYDLENNMADATRILRMYADDRNWVKTPLYSQWVLNPNASLLAKEVLKRISEEPETKKNKKEKNV